MKITPTYLLAVSLVTLTLSGANSYAQSTGTTAEDLNVLTGVANPRQTLPNSLNQAGLRFLAERERRVAQLSTREEIGQRQRFIREKILQAIGGLPERTPLNAKVTGTLKRNGYRIEKIIFESQPAFYITANLYLPETGRGPYPGILMPLGHENGGKAHDAWQRLAITFAKNGFAILLYEPVSQGERVQLYDPDLGESKVRQATTEHTLAGTQCLLLGHSFARHVIWDGMRALDYLISRPEVDSSRIGCTGNSGGGTLTAYLSALDDRIKVAAPSCYLTNWKSLLETIGPQDAEQNLPPFLSDGLDQADFVTAFAPKPYLILSAARDFFPIAGTRQTFREVKRLYGLMGAEEKLNMLEADDGHGYTRPRRLAAYRWMNRWLKGPGLQEDEPIDEPEIEIESEDDLRCTQAGQVSLSLGGETIFSINLAEARKVKPKRSAITTPEDLRRFQAEIRDRVQRLTAFEKPAGSPDVRAFGEIARDGYRIEKLLIEGDPAIPALLFKPDGPVPKRRAILYVHENGKAAEANVGGEIEDLVRGGAVVLAIDLRGRGETREEAARVWDIFGHFESAMTALLVGKTLVGLRAQDVVRAVDALAARRDVEIESLSAFGRGDAAVPLLHAAALDDRIKSVTLEEMLVSYESVVEWKIHQEVFESVVPAALANYDLPDLAASLAPRKLQIINAVNPRGQRMETQQVKREYEAAQKAFAAAGAPQSFSVAERKPGKKLTVFVP
ncbi:MAG: alpha/beta hydrolase family protein [Blastocatellia bacterium]